MIIALLFNWRAYPQDLNYWHEIREAVFSTGLIQRADRHMKLSIGDVIVGLERGQDAEALYVASFHSSEWRLVDEDRLIEGFPTIFGMVFENMPRALATELHSCPSRTALPTPGLTHRRKAKPSTNGWSGSKRSHRRATQASRAAGSWTRGSGGGR